MHVSIMRSASRRSSWLVWTPARMDSAMSTLGSGDVSMSSSLVFLGAPATLTSNQGSCALLGLEVQLTGRF